MAIDRISTLLTHHRTMSDFGKVQARMSDLQNQISSGLKTDLFKGLGNDVDEFIGVGTKINRFDTYINNNAEAVSRLETAKISMGQIYELAEDIKGLMTSRNGAVEGDLAFEHQLRSMRENISNELNINVGGRYLFSGTRTNTPPIKETIPAPVTLGTPDNGYYQGSEKDYSFRAMDDYEFSHNARADHPAFQKIYAGIAQGIEGHSLDDNEALANAQDLISEGLAELNSLQAENNFNIVDLERIAERHDSSKTYFTTLKENIIKTDVLTASTQVAIDQTILTATFQTFGRVSSLSLADYL